MVRQSKHADHKSDLETNAYDCAAHCIDFLRQSAMCHGDVGLITYEWNPLNRIPLANITQHQCVDWTRLSGWMEERSVDMLKPGWLVHPTLGKSSCSDVCRDDRLTDWLASGVAYPDGQGDKIGVEDT